MIRAVFFDASGVLYDRARPTEEFAEEFVRAAGFVRAPDAAERARQEELRHAATIGAADHLAYWQHFLRVRGVPVGERERELLEAILAQNDRVHAKPGGRETLGGLRARGILTGAITDTMYPLASKLRWLAAAGVEGLFDVFVCSSAVGVRKPDPLIYGRALAAAGVAAHEAIFVGHAVHELEGAAAVGMTTAVVYPDPGARGDYQLAALTDLLDLPPLVPAP